MLHVACRLKPPVIASTSSTSPAKKRWGQTRLSSVFMFIDDSDTPSQVTNSSRKRPLPLMVCRSFVSVSTSRPMPFLPSSPHRFCCGSAALSRMYSHRREGRLKGRTDANCFCALVMAFSSSAVVLLFVMLVQFTATCV